MTPTPLDPDADPPWDELLQPVPVAPGTELRDALRTRTGRRVRFRRRLRQVRMGVTLAAVFAAGLVVRGWLDSPAPHGPALVVQVVAPPAQPPAPPYVSPAQLELEAEQMTTGAEAARRFREAGDRYLAELGDLRAALRCYRNFLDEAEPADRAMSATDNWLLVSLKRDRLKEGENAKLSN